MNVTGTGHIRTWMQPLMDARAYGRNRLRTVQKMNVTALVLHIAADRRDRFRTLQRMDYTADGRDRYRTSKHMDFTAH